MPLIRVAPDARGLLLEGSAEAVARAEDGSLDVVFHGFLFNEAELAQRLRQPPTNEAELLLSGYVEHGRALFQELRGAFALVVWDARARLLLATRDPVGIHPLFYTRIGRDLVLSWSIDALLAAGAPRDVNRVYVAEHLLHRWRSLDETYFSSIRRVPAGHLLRFGTGIDVERYWRPSEIVPTVAAGGDAWVDELEYRLEQAVERCLELGRAGVYLSGGGVDSTTVAVAAARTSARRGLPLPVALCVGFPDAEANEEEEQRQVASALGLTRRTRSADARASGDVPLIESSLGTLAVRGAPIGIPWDGAFLALAEDARGCGCSVVLTGDGGDEWLTVSRVHAADLLRQLRLRKLGSLLARETSRHGARHAASTLWLSAVRPVLRRSVTRALARVAPSLHARYRQVRHPLPVWLAPDPQLRQAVQERLDTAMVTSRNFAEDDRESTLLHPLTSMYFEDWFTAGRRLGITFLHPFWDADVVALLFAAPAEMLELGGRPKGLATTLVQRRLPSLGDNWPRKATAGAFLGRVVTEGLPAAWPSIGGIPTLEELGIVDAQWLETAVQTDEVGNTLLSRDAWAIVTSEFWLRPRIER